jgi:hypothetical protein
LFQFHIISNFSHVPFQITIIQSTKIFDDDSDEEEDSNADNDSNKSNNEDNNNNNDNNNGNDDDDDTVDSDDNSDNNNNNNNNNNHNCGYKKLPHNLPLFLCTATYVNNTYKKNDTLGYESIALSKKIYNGVTKTRNLETKILTSYPINSR